MNRINISGLLIIILAVVGCNSFPSKDGDPTPVNNYQVQGTLVRDLSNNTLSSVVKFKKNNVADSLSTIKLNNDTLFYSATSGLVDSSYSFSASASSFLTGAYSLNFSGAEQLNQSISVTLLDTFSISSIIPPIGIWIPGDGNMQLVWTAVANAEGYVMAVVKRTDIYSGSGYNAYISVESGPSGSVPPDAFYDNGVNNLIPGMYNIYIYAYTGSPEKTMADMLLPTPFPTQLSSNISLLGFSGNFGTVTVSYMDSIEVIAN